MNSLRQSLIRFLMMLGLCGLIAPALARDNPSLWIIGDSTVKNGADGMVGWGECIAEYFDTGDINVHNRARGGRSSRSYINEGIWDGVLAEIKEGDFLLIQFGHNDGGREYFDEKGRASLPGYDDDTKEGERPDGTEEVVHTYGWYLRKYVADAGAKGAETIILSPIPRNKWDGGDVLREDKAYGEWAKKAARKADAAFLDLNEIVADYYDDAGPEAVKRFFPKDWTHTNAEGAALNALCVVEGLRKLDTPLKRYLVPSSRTEKALENMLEELGE